eukprot:gnl/Spiro4/23956_TR11863_c0_g1_i1.p1 gnl/Spiro4/23956_TR11863_c0_g1~~gnl/Spiro4/23956_TR11863_c0_g1_i1.p1  ORF type:complete len:314 (-),score=78.00 gnl/Spiro4/23956_TR11863_c0_g1_i1:157-1098(-)
MEGLVNEALKERRITTVHRDQLRLRKWNEMLIDFRGYRQRYPSKVRARVRKGIPDSLRGFVWQELLRSGGLSKLCPDYYQSMLSQQSRWEPDIIRDIPRTYPKHIFYREFNGIGQRSLFNVLKAYSVHDAVVGYMQGMGFIVGLLLLYMTEEDAFWFLVCLMKNHGAEGVFQPGLPLLKRYVFIFDKLVHITLPRLYNHFLSEKVLPDVYANQWFISLFSHKFPFQLVLRVWDIFFFEGYGIILRLGIALLKMSQDFLLLQPFDKIIPYIKALHRRPMDPDEMINSALSLSFPPGTFKTLYEQYQPGMESDAN